MKSEKIKSGDIADMKISALPTRPNAPSEFGGRGYTSHEMKEAFDKLPLHIIDCFNRLIDDITGESGESVCDAIRTGIYEEHTLSQLFLDIKGGELAAYLTVPGGTLSEYLLKLREDINKIAEVLEITL